MKNKPLKTGLILSTMGIIVYLGTNYMPTPTQEISLSPKFPIHHINYKQSPSKIQAQFDTEMWETFVALCWPADNLSLETKGRITDKTDGRAIFENYSFNYDLFLLNLRDSTTDFKPIGWEKPDALDLQRRTRWNRDCPDLVALAKAQGITNMASILPLDEFIQASNAAKPHVPLIDQNKKFVWSAVSYNQITFDFVIDNDFDTVKGVLAAKKKAKKGQVHQVKKENTDGKITYQDTFFNQMVNVLEDKPGAIHLKTSWKILGKGDDPTKFHTAWAATLFKNVNFIDSKKVSSQCDLVQVGLVGMHIALKTEDQPNFIWATFEHIDNCPEKGNIENKQYSFYNYAEKDSKIPNTVPYPNENVNDHIVSKKDFYAAPKWFNPRGDTDAIKSSQILREDPIPAGTQGINKVFQKALANTVWANYQLVGTQWTHPFTQKIIPDRLANSTLESFEQKGASCLGCHNQVRPNTFKGGPNDFQFTMLPDTIGNVLNLRLNLMDIGKSVYPKLDTAVYSDYMYSLLKWTEKGQLTSSQISKKN